LCGINTAINVIGKGNISPIKYQVRGDLNELRPSTKRAIKKKALSAVHCLLDCFAPGQSSKLMDLMFSPVRTPSMADHCISDDSSLFQLISQLYADSTDKRLKKQLLSMIAKSKTKQELQEAIPGVTTYAIDQARLHAHQSGSGMQLYICSSKSAQVIQKLISHLHMQVNWKI
jgi:hypothetical protein